METQKLTGNPKKFDHSMEINSFEAAEFMAGFYKSFAELAQENAQK